MADTPNDFGTVSGQSGAILGEVLSLHAFMLVALYVLVSGSTAHGITSRYTGLSGMTQEVLHGFILVILYIMLRGLLPTDPQTIGNKTIFIRP
jgi:hypothetical protein